MKQQTRLTLSLTGWVLALAWPAAADKERPSSPLAGVAALDQTVTLTEIRVPLAEVIRKVAAGTGVKLIALPDVADEPVSVVVKDLPARELLEQLADLLDYLWSRRGREGAWRYEIWQDLAAKQREAALREARATLAERRLQEKVRRYQETARLPDAQIRALADEQKALERQLDQLSSAQMRALRSSGQLTPLVQRMQRLEAAPRLLSPIARSLVGLLGQLSPAQWATLSAGRKVVFSTSPGEGQVSLPEELLRTFRATPVTIPENFSPESPPEEAAEQQRYNEELRDRWKNAAGYRVTIKEDRSMLQTRGVLSLQVVAQATRTTDATSSDFYGGDETSQYLYSSDGSEALELMTAELSPQRRAELERDPVLGASKSLPSPSRTPEPGPQESARGRELRKFLLDLTRTFAVDAIADAYDEGFFSFGNRDVYSFGPMPLWQLLDLACGSTYRWDHRGRILRFRSCTWFIERPRETPQRLIRLWQDQLLRQAALSMDMWAEIGSLRDEQLQYLPVLADRAALPHEFNQVYQQRHLLRLYAALAAAQRQALWQGRRLSLAGMTSPQRQFFLTALRERRSGQSETLEAASLATAGLSLEQVPRFRVREQQGDTVSYRVENLAPPGAAPSPESPSLPAGPTGKGPGVSWHPVIVVRLFEHYGPETHGTILTVAPPP